MDTIVKVDPNNNNNIANINIADNEISVDLSDQVKKLATNKIKIKDDENKKQAEMKSLIETSTQSINDADLDFDITLGIKEFEFDSGLPLINNDEFNYRQLRKRSHALISSACAQAVYFVAMANRIKRNAQDIKDGLKNQTTNLLLNQINRVPGLQIGIIGCGRLGRQLANSFLEYADVYPNELQISTRQYDTLTYFKNKNVTCLFNNAKVASSVNILFICVLASQLQIVIDDIKKFLPNKSIIYCFIQTETASHLKNLIHESTCGPFIIKPDYIITDKFNDINFKWNLSKDINELLISKDYIPLINPFGEKEEMIFQRNNYSNAAFLYGILNVCIFLGLNKQQAIETFETFLLQVAPNKKPIQLDASYFLNPNEYPDLNKLTNLPEIDLVKMANCQSPLMLKYQQSKSFRNALKLNFVNFFEDVAKYK